MRRRALLTTALPALLLNRLPAHAAEADGSAAPVPEEVLAELPGARLQGSGRLRYMGFQVYGIRLWTGRQPAGDDWAAVPLALEIGYARAFKGADIAERALSEMRRQSDIAPAQGERWLAAMRAAFPDVVAGDRLTGVQRLKTDGAAARFFLNGKPTSEVADAPFTRLFFGIWLSARSSEPALRDALLGKAP